MNISFDLDNTLIPYEKDFEVEHINSIASLIGIEPIRKGTIELMKNLKKEGHKIYIYTTSYRSKNQIRLTFLYYGIKITRIINQIENQKKLKSLNINASKYPKAFNIDIHIDDAEGVKQEGLKYNFKTIIINPNDKDWIEKIKLKINDEK